MRLKFPIAFFLASSVAVWAQDWCSNQLCPSGGAICVEGTGLKKNEAEIDADTKIANRINSDFLAVSSLVTRAEDLGDDESLSSSRRYGQDAKRTALFKNAHKAESYGKIDTLHGELVLKRYVCRSDAAKPYLESLKKSLSELKVFAQKRLDEKSCNAAKEIYYNEIIDLQGIVESLKQPNPMKKEYEEVNKKIEKECCRQRARKLHWNPEKNTPYSDVAFARLSQKFKIEKSRCAGNGISLVYKAPEVKCQNISVFRCTHQPSLSIASCNGAEHKLLKSADITSYHQREDNALDVLKSRLKDDAFWNEWEQEIQQWSPQCE